MMANPMRIRRIIFKGPKVRNATRRAISKAMHAVAREQEAALQARLGPRTPIVSNPYTSPNSKSGDLSKGTSVRAEGHSLVVRTLQYGVWLEGGTSTMKPRPWIWSTMLQKRWDKKIAKLARQYSKR